MSELGIVIITKDDSSFLEGKTIICYKHLDVVPNQPDVTYILRKKTTNEQEVLSYLDRLENRLVICVDKMPSLKKLENHERVIIHNVKERGNNFANSTRSILKENDRLRAYYRAKQVPVPYALSFILNNVTNIEFHRRLATIGFELDDSYTHALFAYGIEPLTGRISWPNKKAKSIIEPPIPFRSTDVYCNQIISLDVGVGNQVRAQDKGKLPKGVKKNLQHEEKWL